MINITEGLAKDALPHMQEFINNRPSQFPDVLSAVRHAIMSKTVLDNRSAGVSVPSLIHSAWDEIKQEEIHVWRTDLASTMPFWEQWFEDLNEIFFSCLARKWIFLSDKDNLDDSLYAKAEGGKFTPVIFQRVGFNMHEDQPK